MNLSDEYIRRQFYIIGLGNRLGDQFVYELNRSRKDSRQILLQMLPRIFRTRPLSKQRAKLLKDLADDVAKSRGEYITRFRNAFEAELKKLVEGVYRKSNEAWSRFPLEGEPDEDPAVAIPILLGTFMYQGATLDEWFKNFGERDKERIRRSLMNGLSDDRTAKQIVRDMLGSEVQQGRDGDLNQSQNGARTLARTLAGAVGNAALGLWTIGYAKSAIFPLREVYTAILDSRTTFRCASLHGNIYEVGQGPYPPQHPNCRSHRYPIPEALAFPSRFRAEMTARAKNKDFVKDAKRRIGGKQWDSLSNAQRVQAITDEKSRWLLRNVGDTTTELSFDEWFARQPQVFQRDYLGPTRYTAWKEGDLTIDDFVSSTGHRYTIEELQNKGIL